MTEINLPGLRTRPLSSYLSALGLFRVLSEQADPGVRAWWQGQSFRIDSGPTLDEVKAFLLEHYQPTPLVAPWNGSDQGGFRPGAKTRASKQVAWLEGSDDLRLASYRRVAEATRRVIGRPSWQASNESKDKPAMVMALRNALPDQALRFLDASVALTTDGISYPPIFGTGGNIGRLDLVINYLEHIQRLTEPAKAEQPITWLDELLLGAPSAGVRSTPGQYDYQGVGGANLGRSGSAPERVNPWSYVLSVEGALCFEATATRRLGSDRARVSAPFTVVAAPAGFASATAGEGAKGEMWMPLWKERWSADELASLLAEGRATWNGRQSFDGTDLLRATRTLGVDRGVFAFERFAFLERNGQSPAAVPVGTVRVREDPQVRLTAELDPWIRRLSFGADNRVPAAVRTARNQVNRALHDASGRADGRRLRHLLLCVARAERAVQRSTQFQEASGIGPVPDLSVGWLKPLSTSEPEHRIALLLAMGHDSWSRSVEGRPTARSLREHLRPIQANRFGRVEAFRSVGSLVSGLGTRPPAELLAEVAVQRARTAPAATAVDETPIQGVRVQFPVRRTSNGSRDPRAPQHLVERVAAGDIEFDVLSDWLEVLLLLHPVAEMECSEDLDPLGAEPTFLATPVPLWRLLAPWFGQDTLNVGRTGRFEPSVAPTRFTPAVRSTWPSRLHRATPLQLGGLAREVQSSYAAARLTPAIDPSAYAAGSLASDAQGVRVLAALMVPTRIRDLADLASQHLRIDQGANQ